MSEQPTAKRLHSDPSRKEVISTFLRATSSTADRVASIHAALSGPAGPLLRKEAATWITRELVTVEQLVPPPYVKWREPVRDAMVFVIERLSAGRLAPKLVEQLELPANTRPEIRLLRLISKVPGLQKLGQVLARHRGLRPSLRNALSQLENGIRDVTVQQMGDIIQHELGSRIASFGVEVAPKILCEGSVSAIVRFTWRRGRSRQRGVFKVLKPYIPECYAEDMQFLQELADFLASKYSQEGFAEHVLPDTFEKVRQLLQHEVDFPGEQATLKEVARLYRAMTGVRIPQLIAPLCTSKLTAMSEEAGVKVTSALRRMQPWQRKRVAKQIIEAVVAVPLCSPDETVIFHADPHAGNMLYDRRTGELVLVDWALTERLTYKQRRHLIVLFLMLFLQNPVAVCKEAEALSEERIHFGRHEREVIARFMDGLPLLRRAGSVDAMALLEDLAIEGVLFPASLIMLSKVMFTLDGILQDIAGSEVSVSAPVLWEFLQRWMRRQIPFGSPLRSRDWMRFYVSTFLFGARLGIRAEKKLLERYFPRPATPCEVHAN
jgi:ubiquinone biosynthesis protein